MIKSHEEIHVVTSEKVEAKFLSTKTAWLMPTISYNGREIGRDYSGIHVPRGREMFPDSRDIIAGNQHLCAAHSS